MKEQYRVAGVIMPNEKSIGFGTPYYQKVGDDKTIFYPDFQWGGKGKIFSFCEETDSDKKEYYHIPVEEEYPLIGTFDKSYTAIVLRDINRIEHVVIGTDMADAFLKVIELSKHYLLDTEAFLWVEKERYLSFRDKIDQNFIYDVLSLGCHIIGIHSIDKEKWNKYWGKYVMIWTVPYTVLKMKHLFSILLSS